VRTSSVMHAQIVEHVTPFNRALQAQGQHGWSMATTKSLAMLEREVSLQSALIAFTTDFWLFAMVALAALPLLLFVGKPQMMRGAGERAEMVIAE